MNAPLFLIGLIALVVTLISPIAYVTGGVSLPAAQWAMLFGTFAWFIASGTRLMSSPEVESTE
ncbi:hypothetical protein MalM25_16700 [Planctomycetes bacterium MalM25]|nr:hypothetical protein MalM25_16700 [Planctomycetes bacterium MalM25]